MTFATRGSDEPQAFQVHIAEEDISDLRQRLWQTRWAHDFGNESWSYGVEREWLRSLVRYWAEEFDWRAQEQLINQFPQYRVDIDGIPIHFIHVRGRGPNPTPIILTHGWPWTFWDWRAVIGPLSDPASYGGDPACSFDVVVPSLPGFGFSVPLNTVNVDARRIAGLWTTLMRDVLGYQKFAAGGGDWGSIITAEMGHAHPENLIGVWLTLPIVPGVNFGKFTSESFAPDEQWMWERTKAAQSTIKSHWTVHQIEPQTLAYALADSPVGTAAWIWGRRRAWSDHSGDMLALFDRDFLCTTASIYWFNGSIASSMRIYTEHFRGGRSPRPLHERRRAIDVPTAFGVFPKELLFLPRAIAAEVTDLRRWTILPRGGHFVAAEQPDAVVQELRAFFRGPKA